MYHLDLFSGLGLFSYAANMVWNLEHIFCEIENWPYRFLKQEYPNARIERDIKNFDGTEYAGGTFLLTAGVPCQPASVAGKRKGTEDDRWLWPEALRVMAEAQPQWCIFENPLGILTLEKGLVFENLVLEMEGQGYAVQPYIIPAGSVGAIHRRYRVWIVAHRKEERSGELSESNRWHDSININGEDSNASNPKQPRTGSQERETNNEGRAAGESWRESLRQGNGKIGSSGIASTDSNDSHSSKQRLPGASCGELRSISSQARTFKGCAIDGISSEERDFWQKPWPEVAVESCIRGVDVSFTNGVYKAEKFEKGERIKRMKALGNTIQWEVAYMFMKGIKETEETV